MNRAIFSLVHLGTLIHNLNKDSEKKLGVSLAQWCLLKNLIDLPGVSARSLSQAVGVHPSTLTQTLKRLERRGLIWIEEDPNDSRRKLIFLSREGKIALDRADRVLSGRAKGLSRIGLDLMKIRERVERVFP